MSESKSAFDLAIEIVNSLPKDGAVKPTPDDQLFLYKYYKQATVGNNDTTQPSLLNFTGKAKWNAWLSVLGVPKDEAERNYVKRLMELLKKADDEKSKEHLNALMTKAPFLSKSTDSQETSPAAA